MAAVQPDMTRLQEHVPREREPYRTPGPGAYESNEALKFHKQRESAFGGSLAAAKRFDDAPVDDSRASPVRAVVHQQAVGHTPHGCCTC